MGETTKTFCALVLMVSAIVGALAWADDRPDTKTWSFRIGAPIIGLLAMGLILKLHFRADIERDYLRDYFSSYFNRNGFCFAFCTAMIDGIPFLDMYFQSQYSRAGVARIALRPVRGVLQARKDVIVTTFNVEFPPAAFGFVRVPIPRRLQGKEESFEIGAYVRYPKGKGRRIRFQDGIFVRADARFGSLLGTMSKIATFTTSPIRSIISTDNATTTTTIIHLPWGSADHVPLEILPEIRILWRLGEPPLSFA